MLVRLTEGSITTPDMQRICEVPDDASQSPHFDFNSAELRPRGRVILERLAQCMLHGPLASQNLELIGRADATGSDTHNAVLGAARARRVYDDLVTLGVPADRLRIVSAGERGAIAPDGGREPADRRVDIVVDVEKP